MKVSSISKHSSSRTRAITQFLKKGPTHNPPKKPRKNEKPTKNPKKKTQNKTKKKKQTPRTPQKRKKKKKKKEKKKVKKILEKGISKEDRKDLSEACEVIRLCREGANCLTGGESARVEGLHGRVFPEKSDQRERGFFGGRKFFH